jgi:hypothetical protein
MLAIIGVGSSYFFFEPTTTFIESTGTPFSYIVRRCVAESTTAKRPLDGKILARSRLATIRGSAAVEPLACICLQAASRIDV